MLGCKPVETPMDPNINLQTDKDDTPVDKGQYHRLVGQLIYLQYIRPDITFLVNCVSQFMHSPTENHDTKYGIKSDNFLYFRLTMHPVYIRDHKRRKNETKDIKRKLTYS